MLRRRFTVSWLAVAGTMLVLPSSATSVTVLVPEEASSIQAGIDQAADGDTVLVSPGVYYENLLIEGKSVVLISRSGSDSTTIDGSAVGTVITLTAWDMSNSVIRGFTITNGFTEFGGGGIRSEVAAPLIEDNLITNNRALDGGGIYCIGPADPVIRNNTITANAASGWLACGGGICCEGASAAVIEDNVIQDNTVQGTFSGGAGIGCSNLGVVTIRRNVLRDNDSVDNVGGGILVYEFAQPVIEDNLIAGCMASEGGALSVIRGGALVCRNIMADNSGRFGSAIYILGDQNEVVVEENTLVSNTCIIAGGAIALDLASPTIRRNIIAQTVFGSSVKCLTESAPEYSCNDYFGNELGDVPQCGVDPSGIYLDPLFCGAGNGNYSLAENSPCAPDNAPAGCGLIGALGVGCVLPIGIPDVQEPPATARLRVTPSPVRGPATIEWSGVTGIDAHLAVYDVAGRLVAKEEALRSQGQSSGRSSWDALVGSSGIASGVYFLELRAADGPSLRTRVVVLR